MLLIWQARRNIHLKMTVSDRRYRRHLKAATEALNATGFCALYGAVAVADPNVTSLCYWAGDGTCDDGGPGAEYASCALGTECTDCGARIATSPLLSPPPRQL